MKKIIAELETRFNTEVTLGDRIYKKGSTQVYKLYVGDKCCVLKMNPRYYPSVERRRLKEVIHNRGMKIARTLHEDRGFIVEEYMEGVEIREYLGNKDRETYDKNMTLLSSELGKLMRDLHRHTQEDPDNILHQGRGIICQLKRIMTCSKETLNLDVEVLNTIESKFKHYTDNIKKVNMVIIHNDFSGYKNILIGEELVLIDLESLQIGDPGMDIYQIFRNMFNYNNKYVNLFKQEYTENITEEEWGVIETSIKVFDHWKNLEDMLWSELSNRNEDPENIIRYIYNVRN